MIDFKNQIKKAAGENKKHVTNFLKNQRQRRDTQQERIERSRYELLKKEAMSKEITISKLLDEVIDKYFE